MNPIALGMIVIGILIFVMGLLLLRHKKTAGIVISFVGLGTIASPFIITHFLFG